MKRTSAQRRKIFAVLKQQGGIKKLGGLRASIKKLQKTGYKASRYQTVYHGTPGKNLKNIQRRGLTPHREWKHGVRHITHLAGRGYASSYAGRSMGKYGKDRPHEGVLLKVRVLKKDVKPLQSKKTQHKIKQGKFGGRELIPDVWSTKQRIPMSQIRVIQGKSLRQLHKREHKKWKVRHAARQRKLGLLPQESLWKRIFSRKKK